MHKSREIGIAVITHKAVHQIASCLSPLLESPLRPRVIVVNSSSGDGTVELAKQMGAETLVIDRHEFNHGATRERARKMLGTEIAIMITPDAIAIGPDMIGHLIRPLRDDSRIAVSYARQLPHDGADFFEAFPRYFNYPARSEIRSAGDVARLGPGAYFCSDSCAAWSNKALDIIGGFEVTLTAEDTIAAARLLNAGYRIAYTAEAIVKHSHRYSLMQEFRRYFDTGLMRREHRALFFDQQGDETRGVSFLRAMLSTLLRDRPQAIPYAMVQNIVKYIGYRVGYHATAAPLGFKRLLSSQDYYWTSTAVQQQRR